VFLARMAQANGIGESGIMTATSASAAVVPRTRAEYEDFLYHEAALLDDWRLDDWLALFDKAAVYEVPTAGAAPDVRSDAALFYISDDYARLCHRVDRLKKPGAHSEWPRSQGTRLVNNVRILGADSNCVVVGCAFVTYRAKNDITDAYFGHHRYRLKLVDDVLRIAEKRVLLAMTSLRPHGRVSILL
jgi:p-cumate 2,3-dioxygenase subunit beta